MRNSSAQETEVLVLEEARLMGKALLAVKTIYGPGALTSRLDESEKLVDTA